MNGIQKLLIFGFALCISCKGDFSIEGLDAHDASPDTGQDDLDGISEPVDIVEECGPGLTYCGGQCVDLASDVNNCGACETICTAGMNADPVCESGVCYVRCHEGWSDLDGDGSCETECVPTSDTEECNGIDDDCDGVCDNGFDCCRDQTETADCGNCGTQSRTCNSHCTWDTWGACSGEGECSPGDTRSRSCSNGCSPNSCGAETRTCQSDCTWGGWGSCVEAGQCEPGTTTWQSCGTCGTRTRTCLSDCTWDAWGTCTEGYCVPDDRYGSGGGCTGWFDDWRVGWYKDWDFSYEIPPPAGMKKVGCVGKLDGRNDGRNISAPADDAATRALLNDIFDHELPYIKERILESPDHFVWEVANEPNWGPFIPPTLYAWWFKKYFDCIKAIDTNASVMVGGIVHCCASGVGGCMTCPDGAGYRDWLDSFWAELVVLGLNPATIDLWGSHPYAQVRGGLTLANTRVQSEEYYNWLVSKGVSNPEIWITEFGNLISQSDGGPTYAEAAQYMQDTCTWFETEPFGIKKWFWFICASWPEMIRTNLVVGGVETLLGSTYRDLIIM